MGKLKKNKNAGITLIALVVTIIVLLILAGISIAMLSGNNGVINRAGEARDLTGEKQILERVQLAYLGALTEGKGEATEPNLISELNKEFGAGNYTLKKESGTLIGVAISGKDYYFDGTVTPGGGGGTEIDIATLQTDTTKPYLPSSSFRVSSEPTEQTVTGGLVITDGENEFVWVKVPITGGVYPTAGTSITEFTDAEYLKIAQDLRNYSGSTLNNTSLADHLPPVGEGVPDYTSAYKDVLKSIYQNGGFYVGRYETGIRGTEEMTTSARSASGDTTQIAIIKENVQPYTFVTWGQAQTLAQGISDGKKGDKTSSLLMGVQWDLVLKFIGKNGNTDSSDWGNYRNSVFNLKSGSFYAKMVPWTLSTTWKAYNEDEPGVVESSEKKSQSSDGNGILCTTGANTTKNSRNNIYDLAGNVYEWTIEKTSGNKGPCSRRGGIFFVTGSYNPAFGRLESSTTSSSEDFGFRVSLY